MIIYDPKHMTDEEVAEMWDQYRELDEKLPKRLRLSEREIDPIERGEMIKVGMVFMGDIPVIVPASSNQT